MTYKLSTLEPKLKNLEKDRAHYKAECEDAQSKYRRMKADLAQVENQLKERERICATYVTDLKEKTNTINNFKRQKVVLEDELNRLRKELEAAKNSSEISKTKIVELQKMLANANQDISKLNFSIQQDRVDAPQVQQVRTSSATEITIEMRMITTTVIVTVIKTVMVTVIETMTVSVTVKVVVTVIITVTVTMIINVTDSICDNDRKSGNGSDSDSDNDNDGNSDSNS